MATVTKIPATLSRFTAAPLASMTKRKVAAYARVSTDHEEQQSSYEAQVDYYTHYIQSRDDWEFVDVYADEGITGCNTKNRDGFNRMVEDALSGRIDLIITKSVSRFARNTVDSLTTIRRLKLDLLTEFRDDDWLAMVDYMTVHRKDEVWVTFKDGSKIKAGL